MLLGQAGSIAQLNERIGLSRTDATLSQIKNQVRHHKTGKPRSMGDELARKIEASLELPEGWMDTPPTPSELRGESDPRTKAIALIDAMDSSQLVTAVRLLDAITQPANGTTGNK